MMEVSMSPKVTKRTRRLFTPEFKAEAVRLVRESGKTVARVARELDLTATCLRAWGEPGSGRRQGGRPPSPADAIVAKAKQLAADGKVGRARPAAPRAPDLGGTAAG